MISQWPISWRQSTWVGADWLGVDQAGELFLAYSIEAGDVTLARRLPGQSAWTQEYVDHPSTRGLQDDAVVKGGAFLAFDSQDLPTLSWTLNVGDDPPTEHDLYFAWKAP